MLAQRYKLDQDIADIDTAISMARSAVNDTPNSHPDKLKWLDFLSNGLSSRFSRTADIGDIDESISTAQEAISLSQGCDEPTRAVLLNSLGIQLGQRHSRTGSMEDMEAAVRFMREAVQATPTDHQDRSKRLSNLSLQLGNRWFRTREMSDLEESISLSREALAVIKTDQYVDRTKFLNNFGVQITANHDRQEITREYLIDQATLLNNLGSRLTNRFSITQVQEDLDEAIRMSQDAVNMIPSNYPDRSMWLVNLGHQLYSRHHHTGKVANLEEAICATRDACNITPADHPYQTKALSLLGVCLGDRYKLSGVMDDLRESIDKVRAAVLAAPEDHSERPSWLNNLGLRLADMYSRTGALADLEEAIRTAQEALDATPLDDPQRASRLSNLGFWVSDKYSRWGAMEDLEESIRLTEEAVEATPPLHPERPVCLNNLGLRLGDKYWRTGKIKYLVQAIEKIRDAVRATPADDQNMARWSSNLSSQLNELHAHKKRKVDERNRLKGEHDEKDIYDTTDLSEACEIMQRVIDATPSNHTERAAYLNNLGLLLGQRSLTSGNMTFLDQAIDTMREGVEATPKDHLHRARRSMNLARLLCHRYTNTDQVQDHREARERFIEALHSSTSSISLRVEAGREFLLTRDVLDDPQTYDVAKTTIGLIPLLTPRSLQNTDKRYILSSAVGISSDAAAIALHFDKGPLAAINCLETGRAIIAGAILQQNDVTVLEKIRPDLAQTFLKLRDQLDSPDLRSSEYLVGGESAAAEIQVKQRRHADKEMAQLLGEVRSIDGFESFILPASEANMIEAARHGPIVILNMSNYRCDALIVQLSGITSLPLPNVSPDSIENLDSITTLEWLWGDIVFPILNKIGLTNPTPDDPLPRIWWIPTGKLTKFPLHAAGIYELGYDSEDKESALDMVVSSYASSVKSIIHGRRQQKRRRPLVEADLLRKVVAVAMDKTEDMDDLPYASREVDKVLNVLSLKASPENRPQPTKKDVLSAMKACQIFHFAGHGHTDSAEPLQSALRLTDWKSTPLTIQSLLDADLDAAAPFLAYLSACGTSRIKDDRSVDESIHLANAFQLAGFCHVVGTLWKVDDGLCVSMARMLYEFLRENGLQDDCVSRGLHHAAKIHRAQWLKGDTISEVDRGSRAEIIEDPTAPALWIPYVHFGV
ncbi:CHAT domain-containing protein [Hypoxylon sp. NC1633]|nr:CHAT domain-containing protein [Hypoxylon sp. NC1633]